MNLDQTPHPYIPAGPVDDQPLMGYQPPMVRRDAFAAVLRGVTLGAYDRRIVEWLVQWDDTTCRTVASLMWRCRLAGGSELAAALDDEDQGDEPDTVPVIGLVVRALAKAQAERAAALESLAVARSVLADTSLMTITTDQAAVILRALADGEAFLRDRATAWCESCNTHPAGACERCVDLLDTADEYRRVAAELEQEANGMCQSATTIKEAVSAQE